jgi:hypothetical protein
MYGVWMVVLVVFRGVNDALCGLVPAAAVDDEQTQGLIFAEACLDSRSIEEKFY